MLKSVFSARLLAPVVAVALLAVPALGTTYKNSDVPYLGPRPVIAMTAERQALLDATQKEYAREQALLGIAGKMRQVPDSHS